MNKNNPIIFNQRRFPAEWEPQAAILMAWPHSETDWSPILEEVQDCYLKIISSIINFEKVVLLVPDDASASQLSKQFGDQLIPLVIDFNDTWTRDYCPIIISENNKLIALDFGFNGWGLKYPANKDNLVTRKLFKTKIFKDLSYRNHLNFILEGGAVESDGKGTLLTTGKCLLSLNRNEQWGQQKIEAYLNENLGTERILWLHHGYLAGDDTDSHIDTLARFCDPDTIAYVHCSNPNDEHFSELQKMEAELKSFRTMQNKAYKLIPLPMPPKIMNDGYRLPATYANFLIINNAVLVPQYNCKEDKIAISQLEAAFPKREIIGINCLPLIKQHGSLHCITMQIPAGA